MRGLGGKARIGNRRNRCTTCNNFAQNVMRLTRRKLKEMHEAEYELIRLRVEMDLYPQVMEDWLEGHPEVVEHIAAAGGGA
jgi:hypothetical protein